jgi:serine/threonine-protein kinase
VADEVIAGRYRLEERLGAGGMSEVWSGQDLDLDRKVAVKLLAPQADRARFEHEARTVAALAHSNICTLYDYGETDERPFMVLEHLPGGSLEERLVRGRPLPDLDTRRIAAEIAAGLAHAHARSLVHRDLKPSNVLFDAQGRAKIADFGIARIGKGGGLTAAGVVLGTAAYISPEQAAGESVSPASDVYSFGVILYRMLAGRLPFESEDGLAVVAMHRDDPPPPLAAFRPQAPAQLESVAMAALAKSPADRPSDGTALLVELEVSGPAPGGEAAPTQVVRTTPRPRIRTTVLAAALLAAAGVGLAIALTVGDERSAPPSTSTPATRPGATGAATAPIEPTTLAPVAPGTLTTSEATTTSPATSTPPEPTVTQRATTPSLTTFPVTTLPVATSVTTLPAPAPVPPPPTTAAPSLPATTVPPPATTTVTAPTDTTPAAATTPGPQG